MEEDKMADPPELCCPECGRLIKNATELPCCHTALCRACAYKKLMTSQNKCCWLQKTNACTQPLQLDNLAPAIKMRQWIEDYKNGGTLYKEQGDENISQPATEDVEFIDAGERPTHVPIPIVKQERLEEEEYSELESKSTAPDLSLVKSEVGGGQLMAGVLLALPVVPPALKREVSETAELEEEEEEVLDLPLVTMQPFTLPNTPSSARTDPQSSGYWSDEAQGKALFGKLKWNQDDPTQGFIECWDGEEAKQVHVSRYEVKCGADSGDLVEFTLGNHVTYGKVATRVKLVEKALPASEEDQIRSQDSLKRSLEISAAIFDANANKKIKVETEGDIHIPDLSGSSYQDIAAEDQEEEEEGGGGGECYTDWAQLLQSKVKTELNCFGAEEEVVSVTECICGSKSLTRCGVCPVYYLRSEEQHVILDSESVTFVARIEGNHGPMYQQLDVVRLLPYPFTIHTGGIEFKLLNTLGPTCIVRKVVPVLKENYVFVSLVNNLAYQVNICPGDLLGICQLHHAKESEISPYLIMEPADRQVAANLPIYVNRADFSPYEGNTLCGFGEIGSTDTNYKHCLVRVVLRPEYRDLFELVKCEMTVQVRRNVWLELVPRNNNNNSQSVRSATRLLPKAGGIIGVANCIMNPAYIDSMLHPARIILPPPDPSLPPHVKDEKKPVKEEEKPSKSRSSKEGQEDPYAAMMLLINMDIISRTSGGSTADDEAAAALKLLLSRTFRGLVADEQVIMEPCAQVEMNLFIADDDDDDPDNKNGGGTVEFPVRSLLKMKVDVTANENFRYFNNCYHIEPQVCTVRPGICRVAKGTRPCVRVRLLNPRSEHVTLMRDAPVAHIRLHVEKKETPAPGQKAPRPLLAAAAPAATSKGIRPEPSRVISTTSATVGSAAKRLERSHKRFLRSWEKITSEDVYGKSRLVEVRYPYFSGQQRPKVPFGIKDGAELTMRVGHNQDAKPMKVLDLNKASGAYSCTICDVVILGKYSMQDHVYSAKHKDNMKQVQVIAGPEERLAMNRPVIQELLEQAHTAPPLLGLDYLFEVLQKDKLNPPVYHCALCTTNHNLHTVMEHWIGTEHNLKFLQEFFPAARARFAGLPAPPHWTEADVESYEAVLAKIEAVHGRKRPSMAADEKQLEEFVEKIPVNQYVSRRAEMDAFFKALQQSSSSSSTGGVMVAAHEKEKTRSKWTGEIHSAVAVTVEESGEVLPGRAVSVLCRLSWPPDLARSTTAAAAAQLGGKFVHVSTHPSNGLCRVRAGLCRVLHDDQTHIVHVIVENHSRTEVMRVLKNFELSLVRWKTL